MINLESGLDPDTYIRAGVALALGLLIGLQRERAREDPAGIRTFALVAISGFLVGLLKTNFGGWLIAAGVLFLAAILVTGNLRILKQKEKDAGAGITTEVAVLLVFCLGVFLADSQNELSLAVVIGGVSALLLYYKKPMHRFVRGLEQADVKAIMVFVLITLVILPVLPNRTFGPLDVVNPFEAWLMVVLIVAIGLIGYVVYRVAGARVGTLLSGLLGGLISSTATTVSASRLARGKPERATVAGLIIMIASVVSVVRVLIEMAAVNRSDFLHTAPPIAVFLLLFLALTALLYWRRSGEVVHLDPPENPAEMKVALIFGALYVIILLAVASAKHYFGETGLYVVALISGLTDVDAITLSTVRLIEKDTIEPDLGWRVILVAVLANLLFKGGLAAVIGGAAVVKRIVLWYGLAFAGGLLIVFLWP